MRQNPPKDRPEKEGGALTGPLILHATTVAHHGRALVILGASGAGKSSLALQLIALGAGLISDDRTILTTREGVVIAQAPVALRGKIEARGIGVLNVEPAGPCPVALVVDLDRTETDRLPPEREIVILSQSIPLVFKTDNAAFSSALMVLLRGGRSA